MTSQATTWTLIDVDVPTEIAEIVADFLWSNGVVAVETRKSPHIDHEILRTSVGENPQDVIDLIVAVFPTSQISVVSVEKSITETWRKYATATEITSDFALVPHWLEPTSHRQQLRIEPFDTFGLGNHPTTVLALRLALEYVPPQSCVFDLGTGSGVLGIALAKFLNCDCMVNDIAHGSKQAVTFNAEINTVDTVIWTDTYPHQKVDAVLANILAPVLIEESSKIQEVLMSGGVVVLSGMRVDQTDNVVSHFNQCELQTTQEMDGWCGAVLKKKI